MLIERKNCPSILEDNVEAYLSLLEASIESVDEFSSVTIMKSTSGYYFRIAPSSMLYIEPLIKIIGQLNTMMGILVEFSKSSKKSGTVGYFIQI